MSTPHADIDLAQVTRDPCCCLPKQPCAVCRAWEQGLVLVAGQPLCTVAAWAMARPRAAVMRDLLPFLDHPERV